MRNDPRSLNILIEFELHSFTPNAEKVKVGQTFVLE